MPVQAKANGVRLNTVPSELSCSKPLEMRLISLRVPFMKMVALPSGKQRCIHGPAVNVPSKLDSICTMLPVYLLSLELNPLKLKLKLAYKGHYMYDYVIPENVLNALRWLAHNPLYANVEINEEWAQNAESNDTGLYAGLVNVPSELTQLIQSLSLCKLMIVPVCQKTLWIIVIPWGFLGLLKSTNLLLYVSLLIFFC